MKPTERQRRIRRIAKRANKSQNDLAREIGISPAYLSMILAGIRRPSLFVACKLEKATGIPAQAFVEVAS